MATLLFLGASVSQLPAIRYAAAAGHRVVAIDGDPAAIGLQHADVGVAVDFTDVEAVVTAGREHAVDGVLAISSDRAVVPAAEVAAALVLPGIGAGVARAMTDKPTMRAGLERAGVPQPRYAVLTATSDVPAASSLVPLPAVLKPADSGGQRGLFMIRAHDDVAAHLDEALTFSTTKRAMLEEYIDGIELNGILVVRDGEPTLITLSDRLRPGGLGFGVGWIHSFPSSLPASTIDRARDVAFAAVRALGLRNGIAFPQLIADGDDVRVVEIAARIAAGQMADLVRFGTGVELFDIAIAQALGRPVSDEQLRPKAVRPIAIRFLTARPGVLPLGKVRSIEGIDEVRASPGVLAAGLYFGAGATITPLHVDADRRGYVVATAESPQAALALADAAAGKLVVRTMRRIPGGLSRRFVGPTAVAAVVAVAAGLVLVLSHSGIRPRLISETIHTRGGRLDVRYVFNEPVRALLLVDNKPATAFSSLRRAGDLVLMRGTHTMLAIEVVDSAGNRLTVTL